MPLAAARAIFATIVLAIAAYGAGSGIEAFLPLSFRPADRVTCAWLGGLGLLGVGFFLTGQVAFTPTIVAVLLTLTALPAVWRIFTKIRSTGLTTAAPKIFAPPVLPAAVVTFVLLVTAFAGVAEITGDWGHDAIAYHLLGPKVWLRDGLVRPVLDNSHTAFPATAEMLFAALMALGGPLAPGFSGVLTLGLLFAVVFSLARRIGLDGRLAWWCVALVAAMPAVYAGAHSGFIDVLYASFVLAAARIGFDAERPADFILFGLFCGLSAATKYTGLLALPELILCSALIRRSEKKEPQPRLAAWKGALISLATAGLVAAPFYARNWILLGCPIYPAPPILVNFCHARFLPVQAILAFHHTSTPEERASAAGLALTCCSHST